MTLEEMKRSEALLLTAEEAAPVLGCNPQSIRAQAQEEPGRLGFPVIVMGRAVRIPRIPLLRFLGQEA